MRNLLLFAIVGRDYVFYVGLNELWKDRAVNKKNIIKYIVFVVIAVISAGIILATTKIGSKKYYPFDDSKMQIVFFGDSNIANEVEGQTIPDRVAELMDCEVYNCAVGGTTAAKINTENYFDRTGDLFCLYNMSKIMEIEDYQAMLDFREKLSYSEEEGVGKLNMLVNLDYAKVDYIVISYGINDYTAGIRADSAGNPYDETTYEGALRSSVERISELCPESTIILSTITYCAYAEDADKDGYSYDWGGGFITEYRDAAVRVASEYENVFVIDNLELLGINDANYKDYLSDGIHFNSEAQKLYTNYLVDMLMKIESNKDE